MSQNMWGKKYFKHSVLLVCDQFSLFEQGEENKKKNPEKHCIIFIC